jgi:predicted metal-binding membrane protein
MSASLVAMMPAMMLPALAPAALTVRRASFVAGYLAVWTAVGLVAFLVVDAVGMVDGRHVAAAVILAAAVYQLTPAKAACLERCRNPRTDSGVRHAVWCIGCSAPLMAALFALGVMSMTWMVVVAALIAAERLLPWRTAAVYGVGAALAALAIGIAVAPTVIA